MSKSKTLSPLEALKAALDWTNSDIRTFEDIQPDMAMLKARQKLLRATIRKIKEAGNAS